MAVANTRVFGGGLIVSPASSVIDGQLELVLAETMSRTDIIRIFPKLYDGSIVDDPRVRIVPATSVEISHDDAGAPLPPAFADGELVGAAPMKVTVAPKALRVLGATPQ